MKRPDYTGAILAALAEGGKTRAELQAAIGAPGASMGAILTRLRTGGPRTLKRVRIARYVREAEGLRTYPRAVYELGDAPDAKPLPTRRGASRRNYTVSPYEQTLQVQASAFDMGPANRARLFAIMQSVPDTNSFRDID